MKMLDTPGWLMLLGALFSTVGAIWASQRQAASEAELRKKSEEITELNKQTAASVIGGDSFACRDSSFSMKVTIRFMT
jgi:hypothetical protein